MCHGTDSTQAACHACFFRVEGHQRQDVRDVGVLHREGRGDNGEW